MDSVSYLSHKIGCECSDCEAYEQMLAEEYDKENHA